MGVSEIPAIYRSYTIPLYGVMPLPWAFSSISKSNFGKTHPLRSGVPRHVPGPSWRLPDELGDTRWATNSPVIFMEFFGRPFSVGWNKKVRVKQWNRAIYREGHRSPSEKTMITNGRGSPCFPKTWQPEQAPPAAVEQLRVQELEQWPRDG